jgi:hypothetical protein
MKSLISRRLTTAASEAKTGANQKAPWNQVVTLVKSNCLISVVDSPQKQWMFNSQMAADGSWEAEVLPLNYTRKSGSYGLRSAG